MRLARLTRVRARLGAAVFLAACAAPRVRPDGVSAGAAAGGTARYKDPTQSIDARVDDLLRRMTLDEKVAQMEAIAPGRALDSVLAGGDTATYGRPGARLGIPIIIVDEAAHGLVTQGATNYPTPVALSSTWDTTLVHEAFGQVGLEAGLAGTSLVLAPVLDPAPDPRWGRVEETFGEDPYLNARMGVAAITGLQGGATGVTGRHHVAATTEHFAGHGAPEGGRNVGPVHVSEHELRELHLRPFDAAIHDAHVIAVMPAYHEVLGVPVHASPFMLGRILRDEWSFGGITVSDFFGVRYNYDTHRVARDTTEAARLAAVAGVDIDLPRLESYRRLGALVRSGRLPEATIDRAVRRVLRAKFAMRLFDGPYVDPAETERTVASAAHLATARRVGAEATTLLKNEGALLPLDPTRVRAVAIIGPHADLAEAGNYAGFPASRVTPLAALRARLGAERVVYAEGVRLLAQGRRGGGGGAAGPVGGGRARLTDDSTNQRLIREAVDSARRADVVVLALGATARMMHEAWPGNDGDNDDLELRARQNELVDAMRATGKPVIVLLFSGGPLAFAHVDARVPAILYCWYLGQETGHAVADVLFGDVSPGGHLPVTFYASTDQLPPFESYTMAGRTYRYFDGAPLYGFGFGLSYARFTYRGLALPHTPVRAGDSLTVAVDVTNASRRAGDEVVQLYLTQPHVGALTPRHTLAAFARVHVAPGTTRHVVLRVAPRTLAQVNAAGERVIVPGDYGVFVGGAQPGALPGGVRGTLTVRGAAVTLGR